MNRFKKSTLILSSMGMLGIPLLLSSCGLDTSNGSASDPTYSPTVSYNGSGSKWTVGFDSVNTSFRMTYDLTADGTPELVINGTYVEYSNQVRKLTVTSATGTGAPSPGDSAYGIEMPGFAFFLKPITSDKEPIVMIQAGACPSLNFSANWIKASFDTAPTNSSDAFGSASFVLSGNNVTSSTIYQQKFDGTGATSTPSQSGPVGSCTDGVLTFNNGTDNVEMYFTSNGGALVKSTGGIIFAAPKLISATTADLAGTYTAIVFSGNKYSGAPSVIMGKIAFNASGVGSGSQITDVATDATGAGGPSFSLTAGTDGLFTGTITNGHGPHPLNCILSTVSSETLLACNGAGRDADGSGNYNDTFFMLGVKR